MFLSQVLVELKVGNDLNVGSLILAIYDSRRTCAMVFSLPCNILAFQLFSVSDCCDGGAIGIHDIKTTIVFELRYLYWIFSSSLR